jgi:hypothetical protein
MRSVEALLLVITLFMLRMDARFVLLAASFALLVWKATALVLLALTFVLLVLLVAALVILMFELLTATILEMILIEN